MTRTHEFIALRDAVRAVTTDLISGSTPSPDSVAGPPAPALKALDDMGLLTPRAVEDGGEGIPDHLAWTAIAEELGKGDAGTAIDVIMSAYAAILVGRCGDERQRGGLAGPTRPTRCGTVLYFEGFGRSPQELETAVTRQAESCLLTGRKIAVVRVHDSDYGVIVGRDSAGLSAALLSRETLMSLRVERSDAELGKIGMRAAVTSVVEADRFEGGSILATDDGIELHQCIAGMRLAAASVLIGTATAAVDYAAGYASEREAFGRTIADFQGVAFPLADAQIAVEAARLSIQDLAARIEDFVDAHALADATAKAVAGATQAATVATATAVNTLGGHGYLTDHPVERWYRDTAVLAAIDFDPTFTDWSATR